MRSSLSKLKDEDIKWILTTSFSSKEKAAHFGVSRQTIESVESGKSYKDVFPEIPRLSKPVVDGGTSCFKCLRWVKGESGKLIDGKCELGFPEPIEEGPKFAKLCNVFLLKESDDEQTTEISNNG
jgi:hypothetical protein